MVAIAVSMAMVVIAEVWQVANQHGVCMFPPKNVDICMQDIDLPMQIEHVRRSSYCPVFDHLQYSKAKGEAQEPFITSIMSVFT